MKLLAISIENFRSIKKASNLDLNHPVTVLVGANEHGKSNILKAISYLSSSSAIPIEDCRKDKNSEQHPASISYKLLFNEDDIKKIKLSVTSANPEIKNLYVPGEVLYTKYLEVDGETKSFKGYYRIEYENHNAKVADKIYDYICNNAKSKLIYFDEFTDRITSKITLEQINDDNNSVVSGLLKIAGLASIKENIFTDSTKTRHLFSVASQKATDQLRLAWRQGNEDDIAITIDKDTAAQTLNIDVYDKNNYVEVDSRSRGFQWFLSFYLSYRAQHDGDIESSSSIFVMDEPGLFLHPKGQKDLLLYLEKLGKNNQVIYTTHSPFMINRLEPNAVKVVVKKQREGTLVDAKGYSSNWKPLRTSLGMVLSDSFYFADKTLVVEGVEDQIYITALLKFFYQHKVIPNIDVSLLSIVSAGGASEVPAMTRIVIDEERPTAVLIDSDRPTEFTRLWKFEELKKGKLEQVKSFGDDKTITIQDLLPQGLYESAVNSYISVLVKDGTLKKITPSKKFKLEDEGKADKQVDAFVKEVYGVDRISKVGIARSFEDKLNNAKYEQPVFEKAEAMIKWIVNTLELKNKT